MSTDTLNPLSRWELLWFGVARRLLRGTGRERLLRRYQLNRKIAYKRQVEAQLKKELEQEARTFEQLIIDAWDFLGFNYELKNGGQSITRKVEFEMIRFNDQVIYYKVLTRVRAPFGIGLSQTLPYKVRIGDLIDENTLRELCWRCERVITAVYEDPRKGVWIRVHRQESIGGLPSVVRFGALLEYWPADTSEAPMLLGIGEHKKPHVVTLADNPHVLVGGATRSGKSNILNCIIAGLMRHANPSEIKFILIDLKKTEFKLYKKVSSHLHKPIITDAQSAIKALEEMLQEVFDRADLMEDDDSKELAQWNQSHPDRLMTRYVIVIDEFAELVMSSGAEVRQSVLDLVSRITNLGRAVGIHLIVATQRPATSIVPNTIKTNMSLVIAGRVQNRDQSKVILGHGGARELPKVKGRMIYQEASEEYIIQTPYISNEDIRECIRVAHGKQAGVIRLDGPDPIIIPDGLTDYLLSECNGSLSLGLVNTKLCEFAINQDMFKAYREDVIKAGRVQLGDSAYQIKVHNNSEYLDLIPDRLVATESIKPDESVQTDQPEVALSIVRTPEQEAALETLRQIRASKEVGGSKSA